MPVSGDAEDSTTYPSLASPRAYSSTRLEVRRSQDTVETLCRAENLSATFRMDWVWSTALFRSQSRLPPLPAAPYWAWPLSAITISPANPSGCPSTPSTIALTRSVFVPPRSSHWLLTLRMSTSSRLNRA